MPGSDLEFYKVVYNGQMYFPLWGNWTMRARTEMGYGDGYADTEALPFYEHFFSGGFGSVRGFENSTLGPRTTPALDDPFLEPEGDPFGGNLLLEASLELIFPLPFVEDSRQFRPVIFFDAGNVFNTQCPEVSVNCFDFDLNELRYSTGIAITWLTGLGPMSFSFSKAFKTKDIDEEESFQFELGRTF